MSLSDQIKREYDPKTAFGNPSLISKLREAEELDALIPEPGKKYIAEDVMIQTRVTISWTCENCGEEHEIDTDEPFNGPMIEACNKCTAENVIDE